MREPNLSLVIPSLALLAGIVAVLLVGLGWLGTVPALIGLIVVGGVLLVQQSKRRPLVLAVETSVTDVLQPQSDVEELCEQTLPLWSQQIHSARSHTEDAINALSERFAGLAVYSAKPGQRARTRGW